MELDLIALIEDTEGARIQLFNQHCAKADDQQHATLALASQLLHQASVVLTAVYGGDKNRAREHIHQTRT
jgi:hypothetical protein